MRSTRGNDRSLRGRGDEPERKSLFWLRDPIGHDRELPVPTRVDARDALLQRRVRGEEAPVEPVGIDVAEEEVAGLRRRGRGHL
ncbi:hypothetical protein D3C83_111000 [compost metagenome]